ncbi:hypothetical protein R0135_01080 [Congregibacter variabilis]|uniref:DUF4760 domain-containing protein n=1 Tax=Congregibacter variabilis TaxID=3081200 RepID=A0ABZ0I3S5_9GAMM|nr:hypothetical protein R0135_01080 [Congregibacter sp. IMCC43200]
MNWKGYVEAIGIVAVVLSLLLVTYELRQNTLATQQAAASTYAETWRNIELFVAGNYEFSEILVKSIRGAELTPHEQFRIEVFYRSIFRGWQNSFLQYQVGMLSDELWEAERSNLEGILLGDQGMIPYWRLERDTYTESFRILVDGMLPTEG